MKGRAPRLILGFFDVWFIEFSVIVKKKKWCKSDMNLNAETADAPDI